MPAGRLVVLKDYQALKEGLPARYLAPAMYLHQWSVIILARFRLLRLQLCQPGKKSSLVGNLYSHRECINKKPDHSLGPDQVGGSPGNCSPEDNIGHVIRWPQSSNVITAQ